jgi:hypothetical protein
LRLIWERNVVAVPAQSAAGAKKQTSPRVKT